MGGGDRSEGVGRSGSAGSDGADSPFLGLVDMRRWSRLGIALIE